LTWIAYPDVVVIIFGCEFGVRNYCGPQPEENPEDLVPHAQPRPRMLAFEHVDLQTQGHDFESKAISRAKESSEPFKETPYQFAHGDSLHGPVLI